MVWQLLSKQGKTQILQYLQAMQMSFLLIQCLIDAIWDISRGAVYEKLPQASWQCTDVLVEIDFIPQGFLPNKCIHWR